MEKVDRGMKKRRCVYRCGRDSEGLSGKSGYREIKKRCGRKGER